MGFSFAVGGDGVVGPYAAKLGVIFNDVPLVSH